MTKKLLTIVSILILTSSCQTVEKKVSTQTEKMAKEELGKMAKTIKKESKKMPRTINKKVVKKMSILEFAQAKKEGLERLESKSKALKRKNSKDSYCKGIAIKIFKKIVFESFLNDNDKQLEEIAKKAALDTLLECQTGTANNQYKKILANLEKYLFNVYKGDDEKAEAIEFQQDDFQ